jgi:hypothetical protein
MRSWWLRCLIILLTLAIANGNAHAVLFLDGGHSEHQGNDAGLGGHDHKHGAADCSCSCDCLGCASATILTSDIIAGPSELSAVILSPVSAVSLLELALPPEPDPPRPIALRCTRPSSDAG